MSKYLYVFFFSLFEGLNKPTKNQPPKILSHHNHATPHKQIAHVIIHQRTVMDSKLVQANNSPLPTYNQFLKMNLIVVELGDQMPLLLKTFKKQQKHYLDNFTLFFF